MSQSFFQFQYPYLLLLCLVVPVLYHFSRSELNFLSIQYSSLSLFAPIKSTLRQKLQFVPVLLRCLVLIFFIIALARPQSGNKTTEILSEGIDILLTIDTSGSMKALDFHLDGSETNRLDVVKKVVGDFISRRPNDRIGMVIFGEQAYTQSPLTLDKNALLHFLTWIRIGIAGDGTSIGNGLATSVKRIKDQPGKSKIIILLTDGRNNAGEIAPLKAAAIAREFNIKVYTIGVGGRGSVPYPQMTPFGVRKVYAELDIDEETLQEIAQITGGQFFRATDTEQLEEIYKKIDQLEKTRIKTREYKEYNEHYFIFIFLGIIFLILEIILSRTIFLKLP